MFSWIRDWFKPETPTIVEKARSEAQQEPSYVDEIKEAIYKSAEQHIKRDPKLLAIVNVLGENTISGPVAPLWLKKPVSEITAIFENGNYNKNTRLVVLSALFLAALEYDNQHEDEKSWGQYTDYRFGKAEDEVQ